MQKQCKECNLFFSEDDEGYSDFDHITMTGLCLSCYSKERCKRSEIYKILEDNMHEKEFIQKMLGWKPTFGDKNNKIIMRLISEYNEAIKKNDDDIIYNIINKLNFYIK